jgi:hypothetical protein
MKLARHKTLWVAERRGNVVYTRRGMPGEAGTVKAKELKTEALAQAFLESERDTRLSEGFVLLDEDALLSDPVTLDGQTPALASVTFPAAQQHLADQVRTEILGGFLPPDDIETMISELLETEGDETPGLASKLERFASQLREELAFTKPPVPNINARIDAAFDELNARGIVALQNAGYTQSDGWSDVNQIAAERLEIGGASRGGCFYHFQDLERAVRGEGLMLGFGAFGAPPDRRDQAAIAIGKEIVAVLEKHGVPTHWTGEPTARISIPPFPWYRLPI